MKSHNQFWWLFQFDPDEDDAVDLTFDLACRKDVAGYRPRTRTKSRRAAGFKHQ